MKPVCSLLPANSGRSGFGIRNRALSPKDEHVEQKEEKKSESIIPQTTDGGNNGAIGGGGSSGGGGGGGGDGSGGSEGSSGGKKLDPRIVALLAGRSVDSFPADFAQALVAGKVTPEVLIRYLELEANIFFKLVWGIQGFRERLLGDPSFPVKVAIELVIGVATKIMAERAKRADKFWAEIDFVGANVAMALIADFMLTWIPAPTLSFAVKQRSTSALANFFAACPDNAFQRVLPGMEPFTLTQRMGAILRNGMKLMGVGFCASAMGVGITNGISALRAALDPAFVPANKPQDVLRTSAAYGTYMSVSSNLRYQIIAGIIEQRGIETVFAGNHQLCHALSLAVRTGNTFLGSLLWIDFLRITGMQPGNKQPEAVAVAAAAAPVAPAVARSGKKGK